MKRTLNHLAAATLLGVGFSLALTGSAGAIAITLTQLTTGVSNPIGIDYHEFSGEVVVSHNYSNGLPNNFVQVASDGTVTPFSSISGLTDEVKIGTARSGSAFPAGTLFTGTGVQGQILRISPDGSSSTAINLPGGTGLMRGSLHVDRTGVFGGELIAVTTSGQVWQVDGANNGTLIANVGTHLEGLITVPADAATYGPLAGNIIAGAEGSGLLYVITPGGVVTSHAVGVNIEDIDMIDAGSNFFGANFGTNSIFGAPASEFTSVVGDILLTQEFGGTSGLFTMAWDGVNLVATPITLNAGSANPGQWEHVTFAPSGIGPIDPTDPPGVPEGGHTALILALSLLGLGLLRHSGVFSQAQK